MISFVIAISCLSLAFAVYLARWVLQRGHRNAKDAGDFQRDQRGGRSVYVAAKPHDYRVVGGFGRADLSPLCLCAHAEPSRSSAAGGMAFWTTLSFVLGAACSVIAGYVGMWVSIRANIRTASAVRSSLNEGLADRDARWCGVRFIRRRHELYSASAGSTALLESLGHDPQKIPFTIVGYGFGASFVALFAQLGGGIYTKAADVGADLVGKVEAGIPEDDPRNPAVIADLVGDNVGDCAGRGADLFESTAAENIGAMILGVGLYPYFGFKGILFPLVAAPWG